MFYFWQPNMSQTKPIHQIKVSGNYSIVIYEALTALKKWFQQQTYSSYFVLVDEQTAKHCLPILQNEIDFSMKVISIQSGEEQKNFTTLYNIIEQLIEAKADRKALLINLGGGVICDMGAFAASIYKRGIDFIQIPTTLLSMVDASVGGKTGINFKSYKNQVGTFSHPQMVYIYPEFLNTLSPRHLKNGYAEIIKHQFLMGEPLSEQDVASGLQLEETLIEQIKRSVSYKNKVVEADFKETGPRKQLNFGHTIGHAIEGYSLKNDAEQHLYHGEAIASGFMMEAYLSHIKCNLPKSDMDQIIQTTQHIFNPYLIEENQFEALINLMMNDKKNETGAIQFALLAALGKPVWNITVSQTEIKQTFNWYQQHILHAV